MTQTNAEMMILTIIALGAGVLLFIAGVIQRMMNGMDELAFKHFLNLLDRTAMTDAFAVTIATLPVIAVPAYFVAYGFGHPWFSAGLIVWLAGSTITKIVNMPIYKRVGRPDATGPAELRRLRRRLTLANQARGWVTFAAVVLMACQFGAREVAAVVLASRLIAFPALWLARKYLPN